MDPAVLQVPARRSRMRAEGTEEAVAAQRRGSRALVPAVARDQPAVAGAPVAGARDLRPPGGGVLPQGDPGPVTRGVVDGDDLGAACGEGDVHAVEHQAGRVGRAGAEDAEEQHGGGQRDQGLLHERSSRSAGVRSVRTPRYAGWRSRPSLVRPRDCTSTTSTGLTHTVPSRSSAREHLAERRGRDHERLEQLGEEAAGLAGDPAADPAPEQQPVVAGHAHEHGTDPVLGAGLVAVAADDDTARRPDRELQPLAAAQRRGGSARTAAC